MSYRTLMVGRQNDCDLVIVEGTVSRRHAELVLADNGAAILSDRVSRQGTYVREQGKWQRIEHLVLKPGMRLRFGATFEIASDRLIAMAGQEPRRDAPIHAAIDGIIRRNPEDGSIISG